MKKIIAFGGAIASGKDTSADYVYELLCNMPENPFNWKRTAFGDALKDHFCSLFNVDRDFIEKWKRSDLVMTDYGFDKTVRESMQVFGDTMRHIQPNIWINKLFEKYGDYDIINSDNRYVNECEAMRCKGGLNILLYRPGFEPTCDHPSEKQLKPYLELFRDAKVSGDVRSFNTEIDYFLINDGSIGDLKSRIDKELLPYIFTYLYG